MAIRKAKVGDYVKVIKKLPYKDKMGVEIGDVGIVNYVASTGKYSVYIDGKKNPHDDSSQRPRSYGNKYDFWIPFECCEVINIKNYKFQIGDKVKINYPQASKVHDCLGTIHKLNDDIDNLVRYVVEILNVDNNIVRTILSENRLEKVSDTTYEEELTKKCLFENADVLDETFTYDDLPEDLKELVEIGIYTKKELLEKCYNKEREEKKMKEIKNQKVVDLYFKRKQEDIDKRYSEAREEIFKSDRNQIFIAELKKQYDEYYEINKEDIGFKLEKFNIALPLTEESKSKNAEIDNQFKKEYDQFDELKEEIIALLSGCDTYEQEMEILHTYNIVSYNSHYVSMNKIDDN